MDFPSQSDAQSSTDFSLNSPSRWIAVKFWTGLVFAASLCITCMVWMHEKAKADHALQAKFDSRVHELQERIEQRLTYYHQILLGTRALYASSEHVSAQAFKTYIAALNIEKLYPGAQDFGIAHMVSQRDKPRHIQSMKRQFPGYRIWPEGDRPVYTAIVQQEVSPTKNRVAIGFDMYNNPIRRAAMDKARDTGATAATGKVSLMFAHDERDKSGFLIYLPFYKHGLNTDTVKERRKHISGWIYAPFQMNELMSNIDGDNIGVSLYDSSELSSQTLLYRYGESANPHATHTPMLHTKQSIVIADRQWTLVAHELPGFRTHEGTEQPLLIAVIGIILSISVASITWMLATGRDRAWRLAEQMTRELKESELRFKYMANSAPVMIWMSDIEQNHLWVNNGWIEFAGRADTDWGKIWEDFIHPDDLDALNRAHQCAITKREPFHTKIRVRRRDGVYRWIVDHGVPRFDERGQYMGYIGSSVDVTERKQAENELQIAALVFRNSSDSMCVGEYDDKGKLTVIAINDAYTVNSGYSAEEVIGNDMRSLQSNLHDAAYYEAIRQELKHCGQWAGEHWSRHKDGHHYPVWMSVTLVRDAQGKPHRIVALGRDLKPQKEAEEMIRGLSASLITAREDEAKRIAREIHDDLGQRLYWARLNTFYLPQMLQHSPELLPETMERMRISMDECLTIIRRISTQLRPPTLDMGFPVAVEALINDFRAQTGIVCNLHDQLHDDIQLNDEATVNLYRILQEALTNVSRHAQASCVTVALADADHQVTLEISDDGIGFAPAANAKFGSHGLTGMKERAAMLGGHIVISSELGRGTTIRVAFQLDQRTREESVYS